MHRSAKSLNPSQEDEIASIDAQLDYINRVLKWSILDLEKFIYSLKARLQAEEIYVSALVKITKHQHQQQQQQQQFNGGGAEREINPTASNSSASSLNVTASTTTGTAGTFENNYFGDYTTSFPKTTMQYESSIEKTIETRREFINCLKSQIELLNKVKDQHEQRRKKVKSVLGEKNSNYISFRTRDIVKLHKTYFNKCLEYTSLQQQVSSSSNSPSSSHHEDTDIHHINPTMARMSLDEPMIPRKSSDSARGADIDSHSIGSLSNENSTTTANSPPTHNKKNSMAGFLNQMKSQIANAAAAGDPSKQTARLAKLKKEITDTDHEYRQGIRILEFLRKRQMDTAAHATRHVEAILLGKSDAIKAVMVTISKQEEDTLQNEVEVAKHSLETIQGMDGKKDTDQFLIEYEKLGFTKPKTIYYDNYYFGRCKDILFGSKLDEYCQEHNRTVPLIVQKCIHQVEKLGGLEKEGIYRISGRQSNIDQLKCEFEKDEETVELSEMKYDVFTIASVLKIYLRELKQPLLSNFTVQDRVEYSKITDDTQRIGMLSTKLSELSKPQRDTLEAVITHIAKVTACSQVNKMTIKNLSVIFTPALFHDHNQAETCTGEWYCDKVLEDLVLQHQTLFIRAENQSKLMAQQQLLQQRQQQIKQQQQLQQPPPPAPSSQQQQQQQMMDSPSSASVMSLPFSVGGVVGRKASLSRRSTVKKSSYNILPQQQQQDNTTTS